MLQGLAEVLRHGRGHDGAGGFAPRSPVVVAKTDALAGVLPPPATALDRAGHHDGAYDDARRPAHARRGARRPQHAWTDGPPH